MKKYKTRINEINKRIDYLAQGIVNYLKFTPREERLKLLKESMCQSKFLGNKYMDVLHYIENCSDKEFEEYLGITSTSVIKNKLREIRDLRHERRDIRS